MEAPEIVTEIPKIKVDPNAKLYLKFKTLRGEMCLKGESIRHPEGWVVVEEFPAGATRSWPGYFPEVHYVLEGKAEITYSLGSTRFTEQKKMIAEAGDCFLMPNGAFMEWKVDPAGPYIWLTIIMPPPPPAQKAPGSEEWL